MSLWRRCFLYITRNFTRSAILLALLITLATAAMSGMSVQRAASGAAGELRRELGGYFRVETVGGKNTDTPGTLNEMNSSLVRRLAEDERIRFVNGSNSFYLYSAELDLVPGRFHMSGHPQEHVAVYLANTDSRWSESFTNGTFHLTEGTHIGAGTMGGVLISEDLAERNGLGIGDSFSSGILLDPAGDTAELTEGVFTFQVSGLFKIQRVRNSSGLSAESDLYENHIFISQEDGFLINEHIGRQADAYNGGITCYLNDPMRLEEVQNDLLAQADIDWQRFRITTNIQAYRDVAKPLRGIEQISRILLVVILALGIILITLILLMWMRDRVREIGILTSIGVKKRNLVSQFLIENLAIAFVAVAIAFPLSLLVMSALGPVVDGTLADNNYAEAIAALAAEKPEIHYVPGMMDFLAVLCGAGVVVFISVSISAGMILRRKPKEILSLLS